MARFTKSDVQFHCDRGPAHAAVNVKIHGSGVEVHGRAWRGWETWAPCDIGDAVDRRFDAAWVDAHLTDDQQSDFWNEACQGGWETLQNDVDAANLFGFPVQVSSEGRSGGWAVLYRDRQRISREPVRHGDQLFTRDDVAAWDAVAVARWGKFARYCRETCDGIPYQFLALIYHHVYLPWREEEDRRLAQAAAELRLSL